MIDINITNNKGHEVPFDIQGNTTSGISLLAQRILVVLLSQISDYLRDSEGSTLINGIGSGVADSGYASLLLLSALKQVESIIKMDTTSLDPHEILDTIKIHKVEALGDHIDFTIVVYNKAGDTQELTSTIGGWQ